MIELKNISFSYPKNAKKAISNLEMIIEENKVNVVIGLNGAGKTTLFDILTGVLTIQEGSIINIPNQRDIVYQTQSLYFSPILKGKDITRLILNISDKNFNNNFETCLSLADDREKELLGELWNRKFGQMSVGERRWLLVTLFAEIDKSFYIFDEPTSGVDPTARLKIYNKIEEIAKKDRHTVLISTHQLQELEFIECKIFVLHLGNIKFAGTYQDLLTKYNTSNPDRAFQYCIESNT
ncbi:MULTISPECIES: AAA family ATPase [Brevibacillus]|jgi:ABC-2 type transport system ATP-binding protein|uniref:AAA family ATPase n=1 Tax=Brevibacillus TaxID=55080 RepID=UPI00055AC595|nr:AAA family ATPase [Brevibacillus borstelensis]MBE5394766.1 ABC transporter ATP-binding protein [Brevibacillus borstelensis]MCC0566006.1 AAA family ATPase [Brevibacillus borstelensis]MCM3472234.1 AAA family ATPase [Brevibacillus borstelensis]MCM3560222.1 AAA family ATPase [Brevibacillus borstelensis]MCM3590236.1 AAA family ATPase [Brevibacillus borstelensis]